jgi:hypothetical protein
MGRPVTGASKLYLSLGFLSVLLFAADAALAHRPYTTQVMKVALPEGQLGETDASSQTFGYGAVLSTPPPC